MELFLKLVTTTVSAPPDLLIMATQAPGQPFTSPADPLNDPLATRSESRPPQLAAHLSQSPAN